MKLGKIVVVMLVCLMLIPVFAVEKGKVYLVLGSDTSIWEGLSTRMFDGRYFRCGLYTDPDRYAYGIMDSTLRDTLVDSYGTPVKMTWWMMAGNVFELSKNCNIPIRNSITLYLMKKYHMDAIQKYDDMLTLHYHNYYWSDYDGDGIYYYNQGLDFRPNQADYEECLNKFLIEDDVFPISFRSGWHFMDNHWQAYQERFIPFDMSSAYPSKGTDLSEPINNYIDWSRSPSKFEPYHPNADDYQLEGDMKQWRLRSLMYTSTSHREHVETLFQEAANGNDQMVCLWSHLPQDDFIPDLIDMNKKLHEWETEYGVEFMYCKDIEAMRLWINPEDTIAPVLQVNEIKEGDFVRFEMVTDGPIFQENEPFIAVKNIYEEYERLDCSITGENCWETIKAIPLADLAKVSVAVCDSVGNQSKVHLDYLPNDIFIDDKASEFSEGEGEWSDYEGSTQLWDLNGRVVTGAGSVSITPQIEEDLTYAVYFHGPGSTTDSVRVIVNNNSINDTVVFNERLEGRDFWQHVGFFDLESGSNNTISFENLDTSLVMGLDVVRLTPLVADKNFKVDKDIITFGEVCVSDSNTTTIKLSNHGKEELTVNEFSVLGTKLTLGVETPFILSSMEVKEVPITFFTDYFTEYNDILTIETDDPRNALMHIPVMANATSYFKIIDNDTGEGYEEDGSSWNFSSAGGFNGTSRWASMSVGRHADFSAEFTFSGSYDIEYYVPETVNGHTAAWYILMIDGVPQDTVIINQNEGSGNWASIGEYDLPKNVEITVRVQDQGGNTAGHGVLRADAVKFTLLEEKYVSSIDHAGIPTEFKLYQNYPNPFNPNTNIYFALPESGKIRIDFYDIQGKKVDASIERVMEAGYHSINWSPKNLASGLYLYKLTTPSGIAIQKCTFMK